MTEPRPRIVVTLPARSIEELRVEADVAWDEGADLAEVRVDRLSEDERRRVGQLFPSPLPLVATYRSRREGGEGSDEPTERRAVLLDLARLPFRWIDLELERDLGLEASLPPPERLGRVVSYHGEVAPNGGWGPRLRELASVDGVGKLVVRASVERLIREILPLVESAEETVVVHTTGASGPLLRAWSRRLRFPLVYAALPFTARRSPVESSQIPVDRLRPFLDTGDGAPLFAIAGRPVGHSRSPAIHSAWMHADGHPGLYVALEFESDQEFLEALGPLAERGLRGLNVTHPFKKAALESASEVRPGAAACGAANCLTFEGSSVVAENTDLAAILRRLEELRRGGRWDGREITVLGAGGAARATLAAAHELGARASIYARRPEAARELAQRFGAEVGGSPSGTPATCVVHATDVGRARGAKLELPFTALLGPGTYVLDWVYDAEDTTVRTAAHAVGAIYEDGWRLLVYQAAASYAVWWGDEPGAAARDRALEEGACPT